MLERCISVLKCDGEESHYYLADSKGIPIWSDNTISIDGSEGEEEIPWTLKNYIQYSNVRYPSKAKFYCVEKGKIEIILKLYMKVLFPYF